MNKLFAPFLPPWVETGLQPAFYDLESGTALQQTARMYDKVNQLIRLFNELSEETKTTVEEYIAKFVELKDFVDDYFENLDVQEEINNKLDAMVEAGTLQEIIGEYLNANAVWGFDTVADMKASSNLINGSYARTLGYSTKNDGGGALYKIRDITNDDVVDESFIIEMGDPEDHLVAEYINTGDIYVEQLGALGLADSTTKIQYLIDYSITNGIELQFGCNSFNISSIEFKTAKLSFKNTVFNVIASNEDEAIKIYSPYKGSSYANFTVNGIGKTGVRIKGAKNCLLQHLVVNNCLVGIYADTGYELTISDSLIKNETDIADSIGMRVDNHDCCYDNIIIQGFRTGVKTTRPGAGDNNIGNYYEKIHVWSMVPETVINSVGFDLAGGANLRDCVLDTCLVSINVNAQAKIDLNNCRFMWNPDYITDELVDGRTVEMFHFADKYGSRWFTMKQCYGYKPATLTSIDFSNLDITDWDGYCDVPYSNPDLIVGVFEKLPIGYIDTLESPEDFTDVTNQIISTDNGVTIDYVGLVAANAETGLITLGYLDSRQKLPVLPYNGYCVYGGQWDIPDGMTYVYINESGKIQVRINSAIQGKYIKLHLTSPR